MSRPADPIEVREMCAADAARAADLTSQLGYPATEADILRRYQLIRESPSARLLVAAVAGRPIVGWIHVQLTQLLEYDPRAEIWGLVVAESARGTGVGRMLVEAAEAWAIDRQMTTMVVRSNNQRLHAKGFYEHLGYAIVKVQNAFRKSLNNTGQRGAPNE